MNVAYKILRYLKGSSGQKGIIYYKNRPIQLKTMQIGHLAQSKEVCYRLLYHVGRKFDFMKIKETENNLKVIC